MENRPEQVERAEVVGKRIAKSTSGRRGSSRPRYYPYLTFKFSDGTVEELPAGRPNKLNFYNAIQEGDMGKLTYKVDTNNGRGRLVSFEKDSEYGGFILEPYRHDDMSERVKVYMVAIPVLISLLLFTLIFIYGAKVEALEKSMIKKTVHRVKVIGRRRSIFAFEFPDGSVKELHDPKVTIKINDTGTITYKELENIEEYFKNEKLRWRGRKFNRLKKDAYYKHFIT
jgi:hypothetical protein